MTDQPPRPDPTGTVAEEAAKLLALLGQRNRERPVRDTAAGEGAEDSHDAHEAHARHSASPGPPPAEDTCRDHPRAGEALTCALCPICQGLAVLRTLHPDTVDRLADLAAAAAAALRELAAGATAPGAHPGPRPAGEGGTARNRSPRGRTVDIEVLDEEEPYP